MSWLFRYPWKGGGKTFVLLFIVMTFLSPEVLFVVCLGCGSFVIGEQNVQYTHKLEG